MNAPAMLAIDDLHVGYGQVEAVRGVSLVLLPGGQIVSVIGSNEAGKTDAAGGCHGPVARARRVALGRREPVGLGVEARVERGLCLVPERRELFGDLSVLDNLRLGAYSRGLWPDALRRWLEVGVAGVSPGSLSGARSRRTRSLAASARCARAGPGADVGAAPADAR